ncbi:hypothetical protein [Acetobacterium bakii]|uniref:Uncharacterized protein n=1 Tax=Acetobacterium bakii TaxID=52689 RepID=A0A0L6TZP9_9FIRM|nr:hypothetical protein [Acetobacterium bakii]KNZ41557.1 hypothetical protein AKG39_11245 [Acetobacterium bakii]
MFKKSKHSTSVQNLQEPIDSTSLPEAVNIWKVPRNWGECAIKPQMSGLAILALPGFGQYVKHLIKAADRHDVDMLGNNVLIGVLRVVKFQMDQWSSALNLETEVSEMFDLVITRKDADFQTLINALSYFGASGFAMGDALVELLQEDLPDMIIPDIREGKFDRLYLDKNHDTTPSIRINSGGVILE